MRQNLKFNSEQEGIELEKRRILRQAYGYRHELYVVALKRLGRAEQARHLVHIAIKQLGDKENLAKLRHILRPWLQVYVNHLCDLHDSNIKANRFNSPNGRGGKHVLADRSCASDTLRIVHQMKNNLTRSISTPSPAA